MWGQVVAQHRFGFPVSSIGRLSVLYFLEVRLTAVAGLSRTLTIFELLGHLIHGCVAGFELSSILLILLR